MLFRGATCVDGVSGELLHMSPHRTGSWMRPRGPRDSSLGKLDVAAPRSNIESRFVWSVGYLSPTWLESSRFWKYTRSQPRRICLGCSWPLLRAANVYSPGHPHVRRAAPVHRLLRSPSSSAAAELHKAVGLCRRFNRKTPHRSAQRAR